MPKTRLMRRERPLYLIPIVLGMLGLLYSRELDDPFLKSVVVLLCVAVPLIVIGNRLARVQARGTPKFLLWLGMVSLTAGAVVTVSGHSENLVEWELVTEDVGQLYVYLGSASLMFGLAVLLYSVVRSGALIDELVERFGHVADHISEGMILTNYKGEIILANNSIAEMIGASAEELIGRNAFEVADEYGMEASTRASEAQQGIASEYQVSWTSGAHDKRFWVSVRPLRDKHQQVIGALATIRDVTEIENLRERLEEYAEGLHRLVEHRTLELQESEGRLRGLLMTMEEGFLTLDAEGKVLMANDRFIELLSTEADNVIGRFIADHIAVEQRPRMAAALAGIDEERAAPAEQEYNLVTGAGAYIPVKMSIAPVQRESSEGQQFSIVVTELTELKEVYKRMEAHAEELERANRDLRELDRNKDVFLSNVSHELRTPLSTVQGYIEMWEGGHFGTPDAPQQGALLVMARNLERLSKMINEMIEFSRTEIRGVQLYETLFSLDTLVTEAVNSVRPNSIQKEITVSTFVAEGMPPIWADRDKISQVLGILLSNAIKFSREGDMITVQVYPEGDRDAVIEVRDTGIGIEPDDQERIFKKFYQVDSSMTRHYQGTGIGLSIARRIVQAHDGTISLESVPNKGSAFRIFLPDVVFKADFPDRAPPNFENLRVILGNQQAEFRYAAGGILRELRCEVYDFRSGHELARAARDLQPDLILIDEALPDVSGADAAAMLRDDAATADIPVILLQSASNNGGPSEAELFSNVRILRKPFTVFEMTSCCIAALEAANSAPDPVPGQAAP